MSVLSTSISPGNPVKKEDANQLLQKLGLSVSPEEEDDFNMLLAAVHDCAETISNLPDYQPSPGLKRYPRQNVRRPSPEEQAFGQAWAHNLKDTIAVAGVPQLLGSDIIPSWTPITDATVNYCHSTLSYTSAQGIVENPHASGYSAGGSTSGGAALVDITFGGDQGGSIRVPASCCGCVGLKPTYGLVPYTGIASGDAINDHAGPIARSPLDVALCLDAICGYDGIDDRCLGSPRHGSTSYAEDLRSAPDRLDGLRVGYPKDGLHMTGMWRERLPWTADGFQRAFPSTKNVIINGLYLTSQFPDLYGKTIKIGRKLRDLYEELFQAYDVVVVPTTPVVAPRYGARGLPIETLKPSTGLTIKTAIFDVTGHPAMSIPVGLIVGGLWQEAKVLRVGHAWEKHFDWTKQHAD
ncbi:putative amidase [Aspergillus homomorphus CBS 101889]|uniref:Amidase signature enzyme n=1 Tax=Aspergillus homomorphus (strain CBS 101889) TaxID=1450537 RepID=A0A395HZ17_ASPHC|nr:amidase signature enzyme [Aspergillus homomorphus CBS 101889]RAL12715.1 amidase signature enzyme [Aspergillus homomorphus CBS 101889]